MKNSIFFLLILIFPLFVSAKQYQAQAPDIYTVKTHTPVNSVLKEYSNLKEVIIQNSFVKRTINYPTQIVRIEGEIHGIERNCDEVLKIIDEFFTDKITSDKFFYNTITYCIYDPNTFIAKKFIINSYFDPLTNEAIAYLQTYLKEHNGQDLLGTPFYVENATGVIVSLNMDIGMVNTQQPNVLLRYQYDNAGHYFPNNYSLINELINDIHQRFYTNDPQLLLPFLGKWFLSDGLNYKDTLENSNYVELQPELIFMMEKEPRIFTPYLKHYYAHHCESYDDKHCL